MGWFEQRIEHDPKDRQVVAVGGDKQIHFDTLRPVEDCKRYRKIVSPDKGVIFAKFAADCLKNVAAAQNKSETEADRMWERRLIGLVGTFLFFFAILQARLVGLSLNTQSAQAAAIQSSCLLPLYDGRAEIYDCEMRPLTGLAKETFALALPGDDSYARLYPLLSEEAAAALYGQSSSQPSLVPLQSEPADSLGIYTFEKPRRYFEAPIAVHTLGYLGEDGQGVSGIERCYDDLLSAGGSRLLVPMHDDGLRQPDGRHRAGTGGAGGERSGGTADP